MEARGQKRNLFIFIKKNHGPTTIQIESGIQAIIDK
jgi:hypothetical protein